VLSQAPSRVCAQPILTNTPSVWSNLLHGIINRPPVVGTNPGRTNQTALTNMPPPASGRTNSHGVIPPGQNPSPTLPRDVQTIVQQFQQQRAQLMNNLQAATDAQRQQVLGQLEQLRDQLQAQLEAITAQAREQALDMRSHFGGHFAPGNGSGGGLTPTGHGGKPRP